MGNPLQGLMAELEQFGEANDSAMPERSRRMLNITLPGWMYEPSTPSGIPADRHHDGGGSCSNNPLPIALSSIPAMWFA